MVQKRIILASTSPRRRELLMKTGLTFEVVASPFEEVMDASIPPEELARRLSYGKAAAVAEGRTGCVVIGADTFIALDGEVLGKPHTPERAVAMLERLSGRAHSVITGYSIIDSDTGVAVSKAIESKVYFKNLTAEQIAEYVATGEPLDRAGAYAIQGGAAAFVEKIEGDYDSIVGLPIASLLASLSEFGIEAPNYH